MAEQALYHRLENYNETIQNKYKDNWGSLLSYLDAKDTKFLYQMAEKEGMKENMKKIKSEERSIFRSQDKSQFSVSQKKGHHSRGQRNINTGQAQTRPNHIQSIISKRKQTLEQSPQENFTLPNMKQGHDSVSNNVRTLNVQRQSQNSAEKQSQAFHNSKYRTQRFQMQADLVSTNQSGGGATTLGGPMKYLMGVNSRLHTAGIDDNRNTSNIPASGQIKLGNIFGSFQESPVLSTAQNARTNLNATRGSYVDQMRLNSVEHSMDGDQINPMPRIEEYDGIKRRDIKTNTIGTRAEHFKLMEQREFDNQMMSSNVLSQKSNYLKIQAVQQELQQGKDESQMYSWENGINGEERMKSTQNMTTQNMFSNGSVEVDLDRFAKLGHKEYLNKLSLTKGMKNQADAKSIGLKQILRSKVQQQTRGNTQNQMQELRNGFIKPVSKYNPDRFVHKTNKKHIQLHDIDKQMQKFQTINYKKNIARQFDPLIDEMIKQETETFDTPKDVEKAKQNKHINELNKTCKIIGDHQGQVKYDPKWERTTKIQSLSVKPNSQKIQNLNQSQNFVPDDSIKLSSRAMYRNVPARTQTDRGNQETAYGFPTIHGSHMCAAEKRRIWAASGAPGDNIGCTHTSIWENENLVTKQQTLQNCTKIYQAERKRISGGNGQGEKADRSCGGDQAQKSPEGKQTSSAPANDIQRVNQKYDGARQGYGALAGYTEANEANKNQHKQTPMSSTEGAQADAMQTALAILPDDQDARLKEFEGRKKTFNNGQHPIMFLNDQRQEKWVRSRKAKLSSRPNQSTTKGESNLTDAQQKAIQKEQIATAKDLFLTWDADGEGSLSPHEIIKAFVSIGLSQDHHFARKIMASIRPQKPDDDDGDADEDIVLKDFITIFKHDEISDNVIRMINEEVNFRKKTRANLEWKKVLKLAARAAFLAQFDQDGLESQENRGEYGFETDPDQTQQSISMSYRTPLKQNDDNIDHSELVKRQNSRGEIIVEVPSPVEKAKLNLKNRKPLFNLNKTQVNKNASSPQINMDESFESGSQIMMNQANSSIPGSNMDNYNQQKGVRDSYPNDSNNYIHRQDQTDIRAGGGDIDDINNDSIRKGTGILPNRKKNNKLPPPSFGEQTQVILDWWSQIKEMYLEDCADKEIELQSKDPALLVDVPLNICYEFLIKKRLVQDRQSGAKLVYQQLGGPSKLQNTGMICYEEFNRLFCKGMFKVALINTINGLQNQIGEASAETDTEREDFKNFTKEEKERILDCRKHFKEEMPLSLKIERYQRNRFLGGLGPKCEKQKRYEIVKVLQSLKYIQKDEDEIDDVFYDLRAREYEDFLGDPIGEEMIAKALREAECTNEFANRVAFIEDIAARHRYNKGISMGPKERELQAIAEKERLENASSDDEKAVSPLNSNLGMTKQKTIKLDQNGSQLSNLGSQMESVNKDIAAFNEVRQGNMKALNMTQYDIDQMQISTQEGTCSKVKEVKEKDQSMISEEKDEFQIEEENQRTLNVFRSYERKEILEQLQDDNSEEDQNYSSLVEGIVNNNVKIPNQYYDRTLDEKLAKKNELLDKLSKLMNQKSKYV